MTKVKICGIRRLESALTAVRAGADYVGFNFVKASKRYIKPDKAKKIAMNVKGKIQCIGVFQNNPSEEVNRIASDLELDFVQLHGKEDNEYIKKIHAKIIKAISVPSDMTTKQLIANMYAYTADFLLLDREHQGKGNTIDIELAKYVADRFPIFFAGGLYEDNVASIISLVKPYAVDVAGGIETRGREDDDKIIRFTKRAKETTL